MKVIMLIAGLMILTMRPVSAQAPGAVCPGETLALSVPTGALEQIRNIQWQESADGVSYTPITGQTQANFSITATVNSSGKYYKATYETRTCFFICSAWSNTETTPVKLIVNNLPAAPAAKDAFRYGPGEVKLIASASPSGDSYRWYTADGTAIPGETAATYAVKNLSATTQYYVAAVNTCGEGPKALVTATVTNPEQFEDNTAPVAHNVVHTTPLISNSDGARQINALNATDTDGYISSYTIVTLPPAVQGRLNIDGKAAAAGQVISPTEADKLAFAPAPSFYGMATFTFTATDYLGETDATPALYSIQVNAAPVAKDIRTANITSTNEEQPISPLSAADPDGTIRYFTIVTTPNRGTLYIGNTGSRALEAGDIIFAAQVSQLRYTPPTSFWGTLQQNTYYFTFTATDNDEAVSGIATYTIPVGASQPIVAIADNITAGAILNTAPASLSKGLSASNGPIQRYRISTLPDPAQGSLKVNGQAANTTTEYTVTQANSLEFTPNPAFAGIASFTFTATNSTTTPRTYDATPATYSIPVKSPPVVKDIISVGVLSGTSVPAAISPLTSTDPDGGTIAKYTITSLPASGILYFNGSEVSSGSTFNTSGNSQLTGLTFKPASGFIGDVTFTFTATDSENYISETAATYTIPVSAEPIAKDVEFEIDPAITEEVAIDPLQAEDPEGIASFKILTVPNPTQGTVLLNSAPIMRGQVITAAQAEQLSFQKADTYNNSAKFTYKATNTRRINSANTAIYTIRDISPFPVTLKKLSARAKKHGIELKWATATELNNHRFIIERSKDGKTFSTIGEVKGNGNSNITINYSFTDFNALPGTSYYRLKQVDYNGKFEYSKMVAVTVEQETKAVAQAYPNPFTNKLSIAIPATENGIVTIRLYDARGQVVLSKDTELEKGLQDISLPVHNLTKGVYFLKIAGGGQNQTLKVIKAY